MADGGMVVLRGVLTVGDLLYRSPMLYKLLTLVLLNEMRDRKVSECCPLPRSACVKPIMRSLLAFTDLTKAIEHPDRVQVLRLLEN